MQEFKFNAENKTLYKLNAISKYHLYYSCNISLHISVLFVNGFLFYDLHYEYTAAKYPYRTLAGDNRLCQSECDKDTLCNGYSIDTSNNDCFLSRCTTPIKVSTCFTCKFASKKTPSNEYCSPVSTTAQMTTTTHTTTTTIHPTTTTMMSTETATTSESITVLDAGTSTETMPHLETTTTLKSVMILDAATFTETTTPVVEATSKETATLLGTPETSESITPLDAATSTETMTHLETATTSKAVMNLDAPTFTETITHMINVISTETTALVELSISTEATPPIDTATASEIMTPIERASSRETTMHLGTATNSETKTPIERALSTETTMRLGIATSIQSTMLIETAISTESSTTMTSMTSSGTPLANDNTSMNTNNGRCYCVCREVNQTLHQSNEERIKKLVINKRKLSSQIRKLHSAPDYRISSKMIGSVAIIILVVAGMLIVLADISFILSVHSKKKSKKRKINKFL